MPKSRFFFPAMVYAAMAGAMPSASNASPVVFTENFNRADGAPGNGWQDTTGNLNGSLSIVSNALGMSTQTTASAAIYRSPGYTADVTLSATTLSQQSGRYDTYFLFRNNGTFQGGYAIGLTRADGFVSDSSVILSLDGVLSERLYVPFQYDSTGLTTLMVFHPDGSLDGSVTNGSNTYNFSFAARDVTGFGTDFALYMTGGQTTAALRPSIDNVTLSYDDAPLSAAPVPEPTTMALLAAATPLLLVMRRKRARSVD